MKNSSAKLFAIIHFERGKIQLKFCSEKIRCS